MRAVFHQIVWAVGKGGSAILFDHPDNGKQGTILSFEELKQDCWGPYPAGVVLFHMDGEQNPRPVNIAHLHDPADSRQGE